MSLTSTANPTVSNDLPLARLHGMLAGYLLMGVGLAERPQPRALLDRDFCLIPRRFS